MAGRSNRGLEGDEALGGSSARRRPSRRHPNNCCGVNPCRRATALTDAPISSHSATICAFCSAPARPGENLEPPCRLPFKQKLSVRHVSNRSQARSDNRRSAPDSRTRQLVGSNPLIGLSPSHVDDWAGTLPRPERRAQLVEVACVI
jgi:hypothetical protein